MLEYQICSSDIHGLNMKQYTCQAIKEKSDIHSWNETSEKDIRKKSRWSSSCMYLHQEAPPMPMVELCLTCLWSYEFWPLSYFLYFPTIQLFCRDPLWWWPFIGLNPLQLRLMATFIRVYFNITSIYIFFFFFKDWKNLNSLSGP